MVITDIVIIITILGRLTLDPAGMHCPAGDDTFVSSLFIDCMGPLISGEGQKVKYNYASLLLIVSVDFRFVTR